MQLRVTAVAAFLLFSAIGSVSAQTVGDPDPCQGADDFADCWVREATRADDVMSSTQDTVLATLSGDVADRFKRAQKAWLEYRQIHLELLAATGRANRGDRTRLDLVVCTTIERRQMALARAAQLRKLLQPSGDAACPF